jgi:hypothetical protein
MFFRVRVIEDLQIDRMSAHGLVGAGNTVLAIRNLLTSRNGGDDLRSEAASVLLVVQDSVAHGNNCGFNAVAETIRIHNVGMFFNNVNLTSNVLSFGVNRWAGNTTTNAPTLGAFTAN